MRRAPATLPHVQPIAPVARAQPFDDPDWLFEPKYDGFRGLLYVTPRDCYFRSKRGNALKQFQELAYWVREELPVKEAILDGEVVALDSQGQQDFRGLLARRGNLHYAAFDVLWVKGKDLRGLPLHRRKRALGRLIWASSTASSQVFSVEERGRDLFAAAERLDLEGIVAKRKADPYGPQTVWYKVKNRAYTQAEGRGDLFHRSRETVQRRSIPMTIQHEPKMALGAFPAFALHGMLLIVGAVVFAVVAVIHLWREWRSQRPVVRK